MTSKVTGTALCETVCSRSEECSPTKELSQMKLDLTQAIAIAQGMEAAAKQSERLRLATGLSSDVVADGGKAVHAVKSKKKPPVGKPCYRCGRSGHVPDACYHRDKVCNQCKK